MLVASRWWLAVRSVMAAELRKWFTLFTLREDSRAPTSLRSPKRGGFLRNPHSLPRASLREGDFFVIPQSATGILERGGFLRNPHSLPRASLQIFLLSISLEQAQIRLFVKIFAERGGFEPPKPFWSLHAFQACLFNHSSISPSSQLACKKKLALRVWLAAVAPLNSGSQYTPKIKILGDPVSPSLSFHDYRSLTGYNVIFKNTFTKWQPHTKWRNTPFDPQRYKKKLIYAL